jgi:hypothetical protein
MGQHYQNGSLLDTWAKPVTEQQQEIIAFWDRNHQGNDKFGPKMPVFRGFDLRAISTVGSTRGGVPL